MCVPLFYFQLLYFFSLSFLFINFGPSLPPSIPSLFFLFSVYHVFLTSMYVLCVCVCGPGEAHMREVDKEDRRKKGENRGITLCACVEH